MDTRNVDDLYYFARVIEHRGFTAAARRLGIPKSRLSRRIAALEDRLGVRLIQRTTRGFSVTDVGWAYHRHCQAVVAEAEMAQEVIDRVRAEPQGLVRVVCPAPLLQSTVARSMSRFLADFPRVRLQVEATNRTVDVIEDGFDMALRVRVPPLEETGLVVRTLAGRGNVLVASRALVDRLGRPATPADLSRYDTLDMVGPGRDHGWRLTGPDGTIATVSHQPRLITDDLLTLRQATIDSLGVAVLPELLVREQVGRGQVEVLLPQWTVPGGIVHAVFPTRRGLLPAVRALIDRLVLDFAADAAALP
ncbi:LysR substrate-binding domain-containing protein [Vineibacter terrae]|uniref:LysR substrate-binding domain-containing protein n=1 Tax=Vineibacter terrae TaxID=2586908 RepID=UPI002E34FFC8|nr:LysR substrate-binding domain-containing protein [Vineibacter terrae]HEX2889984.1 LysR substrate-binding domain-containing protein [Vineibacter terrae]